VANQRKALTMTTTNDQNSIDQTTGPRRSRWEEVVNSEVSDALANLARRYMLEGDEWAKLRDASATSWQATIYGAQASDCWLAGNQLRFVRNMLLRAAYTPHQAMLWVTSGQTVLESVVTLRAAL